MDSAFFLKLPFFPSRRSGSLLPTASDPGMQPFSFLNQHGLKAAMRLGRSILPCLTASTSMFPSIAVEQHRRLAPPSSRQGPVRVNGALSVNQRSLS